MRIEDRQPKKAPTFLAFQRERWELFKRRSPISNLYLPVLFVTVFLICLGLGTVRFFGLLLSLLFLLARLGVVIRVVAGRLWLAIFTSIISYFALSLFVVVIPSLVISFFVPYFVASRFAILVP